MKYTDAHESSGCRGEDQIARLRTALKEKPGDPVLHFRLGEGLLRTWNEATRKNGLKHLAQAAKLDKNFSDPIELIAVDAALDEPNKAVRLYKKAAAIRRGQGDAKRADKLLDSAATLINDAGWEAKEQGDDVLARKKALKALDVYPYCVDARNLLGNIAMDRLQFREAEKLYRAAVHDAVEEQGGMVKVKGTSHWLDMDTRPYMRARHGLGLSLMHLHRYDEALKEFEIMLDLNPGDNQGIRFLLADVHHLLGNLETAEKHYREYGESDGKYSYALLLHFQDKKSRAADMLKASVSATPMIAKLLKSYLGLFVSLEERKLFRWGELPHLHLHATAIIKAWNDHVGLARDYVSAHHFESAHGYCNLCGPLWLRRKDSLIFLEAGMIGSE